MVSILPPRRGPVNAIADAMSQFSRNLPNLMEQRYQQGQLREKLGEIGALAKTPGIKPMDIALKAMEAGAGIPGSERYLAQIIPMLTKFAESEAGRNVQYPVEEGRISRKGYQEPQQFGQPQVRTREPSEAIAKGQRLPGFMGQEQLQELPNYPTNIPPSGFPGNLPQEATTGVKQPLLSRSEKMQQAKQLNAEKAKNGIHEPLSESLAEINAAEEDKKELNQIVEDERKARVESQKTYGKKASDYLLGVLPNATPEQQAVFAKLGEQVAGEGKSEAEKDLFLSKEATNFANVIDTVKKDLSAPRLYNMFQRKFQGTHKDFEQAASDLRSKLQPILKYGLYDTARDLLKALKYYPEERETIINPMSERQKIMMNQVPEAKREKKQVPLGFTPGLQQEYTYSPGQLNNVKDGLKLLQKADPNFSLVLGRKAFEDKGYNWRMYRDALNDLMQNENFELSGDQKLQQTYLDTPPLTALEKVLHGLNLQGR